MKYYQEDIGKVLENIKSSKSGLTKHEAIKRLNENGLNQLKVETKINPVKIFIEQFKSFIIYILIFAVILSFFLGHIVDALLVLIILLVNAFIGFFQELSAAKSLEALKNLNKINVKVYRDSKLTTIDSKYLVVGDIIYLEAGDKVPADCRIIEARKLKVEEASLTGESLAVEKYNFKIEQEVGLAERKNMLYSSTSISEGSAKAVVVNVGMRTEIGKIAKLITNVEDEKTPLQVKLDQFGKKLSYVIIGICIFVFIILLFTKGYNIDNLLTFSLIAVSLAVAAVPTALPAVVTIALSVGVKRLLKKKALVRKLSSVETLGSCNIICTDKTGTLTQNQMTVRAAWTLDSQAKIEGVGYTPQGYISEKINPLLFKIGFTCNNSAVYKKEGFWTISGDPTEAALIVSAKKAKVYEDVIERVDELPFDSSRKLMSVLIKKDKDYIMHTKGAPNLLLEKCTHVLINEKQVKITSKIKDTILKQVDTYSSQALRVLGFAYKIPKDSSKDFTEENLVFVGLQAMSDPPRPDVIESIKKTKLAKIRVIMITGDYKETAKAIGKEIGIESNTIITGDDLDKMNDEELEDILKEGCNIFARVIPEHKQRIITALQKQKNIVAMTGDGVNDAPALKKANIGIAVGSGTDVAKEAADFVLLDDSFSNIVNAIEEGRGIYDNIQKSIMLLLSGNFGEILIIFLAVLFQLNLPLTAVLLLWINMITDGAPALALSVDPYDENIMKREPIKSNESILPKNKLYLIMFRGFIVSIVGLFLFNNFNNGALEGSYNHILAQTILFNFIILSELLLIFIIRKQYGIKVLTNFWLWVSIGMSLTLQALILYTPLNKFFNIIPLDFIQLIIVIVAASAFYIFYIFYKMILGINNKNLKKYKIN